MTRWQIHERPAGLKITIEDLEGPLEPVLQALGECQAGRCSCPTDEYRKLESMDVSESDGLISIELSARSGERLERGEVERCLRHTVGSPT